MKRVMRLKRGTFLSTFGGMMRFLYQGERPMQSPIPIAEVNLWISYFHYLNDRPDLLRIRILSMN